jgi:hypothetical protein
MVGQPSLQAGAYPSSAFVRNNDGSYLIVPSKQTKQAIEDDIFSTIPWHLNNRLGGGSPPPKSWLPPGYSDWSFNRVRQSWYPVRSGFWNAAKDHLYYSIP